MNELNKKKTVHKIIIYNFLGDVLKRTSNSQTDKRVCFKPDKWQQDLLDIVDNRESAVICCPTSSGKTFISYYAMEQSLRLSNSDVVVFVSPNKSLANQVAAEVYARFSSKSYPKNDAKASVYAMSMPDYVVNDPFNCQILITVPTTFESILSQNSDWISNVKYIIIDEVQTLNDEFGGSSIEKIIHFAQCPILALSATIGNLDPFYEWMKSIQKSKGIMTHKIVHHERFCDLKKFTFVPRALQSPDSSTESTLLPVHELFGYSKMDFFEEDNKFSGDFKMIPSDIVELLDALKKIGNTDQHRKLIDSIRPENFFKSVLLKKNDVKRYETFLIDNLRRWCKSQFLTEDDIEKMLSVLNAKCQNAFKQLHYVYGDEFASKSWMHENIGNY